MSAVVQEYQIEKAEEIKKKSPLTRAGVLWGVGLNCQDETAFALRLAGFDDVLLLHTTDFLSGHIDLLQLDALVIPGGFSYADDLGSGQVLAQQLHVPLGDSARGGTVTMAQRLLEFCAAGGFLIGICNGFQVLMKSGLLPGTVLPSAAKTQNSASARSVTLTWNRNGHFTDRWVHLRAEAHCRCPLVAGLGLGDLPVRHGEGRIQCADPQQASAVFENLFSTGRVAFCYVDEKGQPALPEDDTHNPNGSPGGIAGLCDSSGQILGLMPHPEAFLFSEQHPDAPLHQARSGFVEPWGLRFFSNLFSVVMKKKFPVVHRGKVRDSSVVSPELRYIETQDRMSAFDRVLQPAFVGKAGVLNRISEYWFQKTSGIVKNHFIRSLGMRGMLVRNVVPIPLEIVVRGYLTGSLWRAYAGGRRRWDDVLLPDGLSQHAPLPSLLVTPTTKSTVHDEEISFAAIVEQGLLSAEQLEAVVLAARRLFAFAQGHVAQKGLVLVDTKFEFAWHEGEPLLIDEVLTPDSSRYWCQERCELSEVTNTASISEPFSLDKEYLRAWILKATENQEPAQRERFLDEPIPDAVCRETMKRYKKLQQKICGLSPVGSAVCEGT